MKKAMLSQPMADNTGTNKTEDEIVAIRDKWLQWCEEKGYEPVNTLFLEYWNNKEYDGVDSKPLCCFAKSVLAMSIVDIRPIRKLKNMR